MALKLLNFVKSLEQQDSTERVATYQLIEKSIHKFSSQVTNECIKSLSECVITDMKSNKECLSSILNIIEHFLKEDQINNKIRFPADLHQVDEILSNLVDILGTNKNKDHIEKIYSIFIIQNFELDTMELFIESIITSCEVSGTTIDLLLGTVINRFLEQCPNEMLSHINLWFNILLELTSHSNSKVRENASTVIKSNIKIFLQNRSKILSQCSKMLRKKVLPTLQSMISKPSILEEVLTTQLPLFFAIIGDEFTKSSSFTNLHMSIIQKGFTAKKEYIMILAFSTWGHFINALAVNKEILSSPKYTKLILQPLKMKLKTVPLKKTCIQTMWMMTVYLKGKLVDLYDEVCLPLLRLCFSCLAEPSSRRLSKQLSTQELNQTPTKDPILHLLGTEMLIHLLCDTSKLDLKYQLPKLDEPYIGTPSSFSRYLSSVVPVITTVFTHPPADVPFDFLMEIWNVFLKSTEDQLNRKRDTQLFKSLFQLANQIVNSSIYPATYLLKLINSLTSFPPKILNSSLNFSPSSFNGTPALSLLHLLFNDSIYDHLKDTNEFFHCLEKVIICGMESKLATLDFAYSVVTHLGKENIVDLKTWLCLATLLDGYIQKTKDVNQGDSLDHDFTSLFMSILYPVEFVLSYNSSIDDSTVKEVISTWAELLKNFSFLSSEIETTKHEEVKMSISNQIVEKLNNLENRNISNNNCTQLLESVLGNLVENVEFKKIEKRKSHQRRSVDSLEVENNLNGFNFALTELIVCLHKVKVDQKKYQINVAPAISDIFLNLPDSLVQGFFLELLLVITDMLQFFTDEKEKQIVHCWSVILERLSFSQELFDDDEICDTFEIALSGKSAKIYAITVKFWELKVIDLLDTENLLDNFVEVLKVMYKREGFKIPLGEKQNISIDENMTLNVSSSSFASEEGFLSAAEVSMIDEMSVDKISTEPGGNDVIDCDVIIEKNDQRVDRNSNTEDDVIAIDEDESSSDDVIIEEETEYSEMESDDITQLSPKKERDRGAKLKEDVIVLDEDSDEQEEEKTLPTRPSRRISARISARLSSTEVTKSYTAKQMRKNRQIEQDDKNSSKKQKNNKLVALADREELTNGKKHKTNVQSVKRQQQQERKINRSEMIELIDSQEETDESIVEIDSCEEEDICDLTNDSHYVETEEEANSDDDEFESADDKSMTADCDVTQNSDPGNVSIVDLDETANSTDLDAAVAEKSIYEVVEMANMSVLPPIQPASDQESEEEIDKNVLDDDCDQNESVLDKEKSIYEVVEMANMSVLPPSQPASDQESEEEIDKNVLDDDCDQNESVLDKEKSIYEVVEMANMSVLPPSQPASDQESEEEIDKNVLDDDCDQNESVLDKEKSIYEVVEMANMSVLPPSQPASDQESEEEIDKNVLDDDCDQNESVYDQEKSIYEVVEMANISILPTAGDQDNADFDHTDEGIKRNIDPTVDAVEKITENEDLENDIVVTKPKRKSARRNSKSTEDKYSKNDKKNKKLIKKEVSLKRTFEEECAEDLGVQPLDESFDTEIEPAANPLSQKRKQIYKEEDDLILKKVNAVLNDTVIASSQESNDKGGTPLRKSLRKRAPTPKMLRSFAYGSASKTRKPKHLNMISEDERSNENGDSEKSDPALVVTDIAVNENLEFAVMEKEIVASESGENLEKIKNKTGSIKENNLPVLEEVSDNNIEEKSLYENIEKNKENLSVDNISILSVQNNVKKDPKTVPSVLITSIDSNVEPVDPKVTPKSINRLTTIRENCAVASSPGILKRRVSEVLSPTNKSRRVSFAEPISSAQKHNTIIESSPSNSSPVDWSKRRSPHRIVSRRLSLPLAKRSVGIRQDITQSPMSIRSAKIAAAIADIKARNNDPTKATSSTTNAHDVSPLKKANIPEMSMLANLSDAKYLQSLTLDNLGQIAEGLFHLQHCVHTAIMKKSAG